MADHGEVEYATATGNDYAEHEATYECFPAPDNMGHRDCCQSSSILLAFFLGLNTGRLPRGSAVSRRLRKPCISTRACSEPRPEPFMMIAIPAETDPAEPRVAATPDTVKKLVALGAEVAVQPGAGIEVRHPRSRLCGGRRRSRRRRRGARMPISSCGSGGRATANSRATRRARCHRDHGPLRP